MASITLSSGEFFRNGQSGASKVVGVESGCNRVARYRFTAPATGASAVTVSFTGMWPGNGTRPDSLRFYIGTDPDSHINAGAAHGCTGLLAVDTATYTGFSATADILLLPDTVYYLFVFPNTTAFGWYYWEGSAALNTSGGSCSEPVLSATDSPLGEAVTVTLDRHSQNFTHTLTYHFGSATGTIAQGVTDSCTWTPPLELASQIPNAPSGVATIYCTTYDGTTQIGTPQQAKLTLTVPDSVVPTVTATWTDSAGALQRMGTLVKLVSALEVEVSATGAYGSKVLSAALTLNGKPYTGGVIREAGEVALGVTVRDSRGRPGWADYTLSVADYATPELTLSAHRCTADGTADDTGEYCRITVTGSTAPLSGNTARLTLTYGGVTEDMALEVGEFSHAQIVPAPSTATLSLSATLSDALLTAQRSMTLSVGYATMDLLAGGKGVAFGTTATREGFVCAMDAEFQGNIGGVIADYVVQQGTEGIWTFRKWNSGAAECWGTYAPGAVSCEDYQWGGQYFKNIDGTAFPQGLFTAAPSLQYCGRAGNFNGTFYKDAGVSPAATGAFGMARASSFSDITVYFDLCARGKWK